MSAPLVEVDIEALHIEAQQAFTIGNYDLALELAGRAIDFAARSGLVFERARAENFAGTVFLERADYDTAARWFGAALQRFRAIGSRDGIGRVHNNLGLVHWRISDLPRAREDFHEALRMFESSGDRRAAGNVLNSLGLVADEEGDRVAAKAYYCRALPEVADDVIFTANVLANLADLYEAEGDEGAAWDLATRALNLRLESGHRRGEVGSRVTLARLALGAGDVERARDEVARGLDAATELGLSKQHADLLEISARLSAATGDWKSAYETFQVASERRNRMAGEELARRVAHLRSRLDMTEARRAVAAAEEASQAKSEFVAVLSHELRTPLSTAVGALQLLGTTPLTANQASLLEVAQDSARTLIALVDDVLDLSRIEARRLHLDVRPMDLDDLIDPVTAAVRLRGAVKGVSVVVERASELRRFGLGDPDRLRQVLLNLLVNAVKFTDRGVVTLRVATDDTALRVEVVDTGIGIAPDVLPLLFKPFAQAETSTARRFGGSGLGLSIALQITTLMHGELTVTSVPGEGSTFRLTVPFPPSGPRLVRASSSIPIAAAVDVLLVEDDEDLGEILVAMLEHLGGRVTRARSGEEAIALARDRAFAMVFTDIQLPGMDGFLLTAALVAWDPRLRVFGLSGAATAEDRARGLAAGMSDYLTKPVTLERLAAALRER